MEFFYGEKKETPQWNLSSYDTYCTTLNSPVPEP